MGGQERQREKLNQLRNKDEIIRIQLDQLSEKKKGRTMNPLIQLNRQLHYLFVALLFASFAVAQSVQAEPDEDSPNVTESAAMGKAAKHRNQRMILFDYTTDRIACSFYEQVKLHGKIRISFKKKGNKVTTSLENFEGVGLTTKREYVADTVTLEKTRISSIHNGFRLLLPSDLDFIANLTIPVTGKHPTDLNSATGDPLPGKDVHFQLVYTIGWRSRNGKVARFIPDLTNPDAKGVITCF
jgi:hypothetical protein